MKNSFFLIGCMILSLTACNENKNRSSNLTNTYYVEVVTEHDSLKRYLSNNISGKLSFYKEKELKIVPEHMMNDLNPEMHFYRDWSELKKPVEGTLKIRLEVKGNFKKDSTFYSFPKFRYSKDQWQPISDLGFIKATTDQADSNNILQPRYLGKEIIYSMMSNTY